MDMDEILIEEVRNRTVLYDLGHSDYKNIKKKELEWREVAANVNLNETECKKKWKLLRDSYKRCKRMEDVASGSGAGVPKKKWKYFDAMSFLDNATSSRSTIGNISDVELVEEECCEIVSVDNLKSPGSMQSTSSSRGRKKKDGDKYEEFLNLAASSIAEISGAVVAQNQIKDSTTSHFVSLAAKIKEANMPPSFVNDIENKVSNLVFAEIGKFYSTSH